MLDQEQGVKMEEQPSIRPTTKAKLDPDYDDLEDDGNMDAEL
ncbi:6102_t:CDS:2, partial [Gigaspora margarita]